MAEAIADLEAAGGRLNEIDLRTTRQEIRAEIKAARERVAEAADNAKTAYRATAEDGLRPTARA